MRRMNSDWRSAQWQLNDLRSVDSVSINQTALSRSPLFFPHLPLALISSFVSELREDVLFPLLFSASLSLPVDFHL